jgi:hypothetical protein
MNQNTIAIEECKTFKPLENGYIDVSKQITKRKLNKILSERKSNRKIGFFSNLIIYFNKDKKKFILEEYYSISFIIILTFALPFIILFQLINTKEIIKEYLTYFNKKGRLIRTDLEYNHEKNDSFYNGLLKLLEDK